MATPKVELAAAYISLVPSLKGSKREIEKEIAGTGQAAGKSGGNALAAGLRKSMKVAVGGGAIFAGIAAKKGLDRLLGIENARASLSGLGHDTKAVDKIMGNALDAVRGTAFGMAEAGKTAASAVAAGVKPGKDLTRTLKLVGDAATIANVDMGSMGAIFNKVAASNKVQMDSINQLHDAGVPALQLIAKELGVTAEEASKMASKGKVDFATFQNAMEKGMGGAALESGKTTTGAWKNMWAAVGRVGANLMSGLFPKLAKGFSGITDWLGPLEEKTKVWGEAMGDVANRYGPKVAAVLKRVRTGFKGLYDLIVKGDFTSALREAFGWYEDNQIVGFLLKVREGFIRVSGALKSGVEKGLGAVKDVLGWMVDHKTEVAVFFGVIGGAVVVVKTIAAVTKAWAAAQALLNLALSANPIGLVVIALAGLAAGLVYAYRNSETFRKVVQTAWKHIQVAAKVAWAVIQPVLKAYWFYLSKVLFPVIKALWDNVVKPVFTKVGEFVGNVWRTKVKPAFDKFREGLTALKAGFKTVKDYITRNWSTISAAITAPIEKAKKILNSFFSGIDKVASFFGKSFKFRFDVGNPGGASDATMNRPRGGIGAHHLSAARGAIGGKGGKGSGKTWPANTKALSNNYAGHSGIDIAAAGGSPIKAAQSGVIDYVGWGRGYGNAIFQHLGGGLSAVYGHSSKTMVKAGQMVRAGQTLGLVGSTGNSSGDHLHFEVNGAGPFGSVGNRAATLNWLGGAAMSGKGGGISIPKIPSLSLPGWIGGIGGMIRGWAGSWLKGQIFDSGGILNHGGVAVNLSGKPERIMTPSQTAKLDHVLARPLAAPTGSLTYKETVRAHREALDGAVFKDENGRTLRLQAQGA